jgi:5-methylcytosine-specific restriction protein A
MAWSKESRHARGYGTAWDKLRLVILARDKHLCQCPACLGGRKRLTPANEVHHIVSKAEAQRLGWSETQIDAPTNLQAVAHDCHLRLSDQQAGRAVKVRIGVDGWPISA